MWHLIQFFVLLLRIHQVGFSNSSPLLSDDSRFPLYSRISPSSTLSNAAIVLALKRLNWNRVAILAQQGHIFTKVIRVNNSLKLKDYFPVSLQ